MSRARRRFSPQFKAEAVQTVLETGKSVAHVARELDVRPASQTRLKDPKVTGHLSSRLIALPGHPTTSRRKSFGYGVGKISTKARAGRTTHPLPVSATEGAANADNAVRLNLVLSSRLCLV